MIPDAPQSMTQLFRVAYTQAGGNSKRAQKLVKAQLQQNPQLLWSIVAPFIDGILAHRMAKIAKGQSLETPKSAPKPMPKVAKKTSRGSSAASMGVRSSAGLSKGGMGSLIDALATNMGGGSGAPSSPKTRGGEAARKAAPTKDASQRHKDAMMQLAKSPRRRPFGTTS